MRRADMKLSTGQNIMCFYDQIVYSCNDWKWGHFRKHCQKEYRIGETCGMRLAYGTNNDPQKCRLCLDLEKKQRRYAKAKADYDRWIGDPQRQASAAKASQDCHEIYKEIEKLHAEKLSRYSNIGSNRTARQMNGHAG